MKLLMIGAGGIGGITAALMKENGYDVTLVCKYPELAKTVNNSGLHIFGFCGDKRVVMSAVASVDELSGPFDVVFIATKATALDEVARDILPLLKPASRVVSMQNGIVEEKLAKIVGVDRTVGCVVGYGTTMHSPGELEMTSNGEMVIGYLKNKQDEIILKIAEMLNSAVPTTVSDSILSNLYSKLLINSGSSTLGAISGLKLGPMLKIKRARLIYLALIKEAMDVAGAMDLKVPPYAGRVNWYKLAYGPRWRAHIFMRLFGMKYKRLKSSTLQSLERGNKTEVDNFNGYIVKSGEECLVKTPVNSKLVQMIHELEGRQRQITPLNFEEEYFNEFL